MNEQEALEQLKWLRNKSQLRVDRDFTEPLDMAIKALEKQIPKKPTKSYTTCDRVVFSECPSCKHTGLKNDVHKYCWWCGQRLDFSGEKI